MPSGSTATSSSITQNHSAPSSYAFFTPAEKPPAPPRLPDCGAYTTRASLPVRSGTVPPHCRATAAPNRSTIAFVSSECSLSTTTTRHGATVRRRIESNSLVSSCWRLYVTTTMASLSMVFLAACFSVMLSILCGGRARAPQRHPPRQEAPACGASRPHAGRHRTRPRSPRHRGKRRNARRAHAASGVSHSASGSCAPDKSTAWRIDDPVSFREGAIPYWR